MTTEVASPRSPPTPQQHSDATTSHNDTNAAIDQSNTLQQLSSQLRQLPQQQLTNLLLQAISGQPTLTQHTIPTATTDATSSQTRQLHRVPLPTEIDDQLSDASGHPSPPILPSSANNHHPVAPIPTQHSSTFISTLTHPIPTRLRTRILAGEYIDFNSLLTYAMFSARDSPSGSSPQTFTMQMSPQSGEIQFAPAPTHTKKINSFALWMEAWNVYAGTILSAKPSRALEFFGYQRIITSLNLSLPSSSWTTYDIRFRTLAASHPSLHWDVRHLDTWIDCIPMPKAQPERWPCPHCSSM